MGIKATALLCLLLQISCASAPEIPAVVLGESKLPPMSSPSPLPVLTPAQTPEPVSGHVTLKPVEYYTTLLERKKIKEAEELLNKIVQSQCFFETMSHRALIQTKGLTANEVARHLQSLRGELPVEMYFRCMRRGLRCPVPTSAVACRNPPQATIHLNKAKFSTSISTLEWASTLGHEGLGHSLGEYEHDFYPNPQRELSVPYSINYALEKCGKEIK